MEFAILGPLRMQENGRSYTPTAPKQRQLLALLLMNADRVVPVGSCIEELWDGRPPDTALSTLHSYVFQLRRIWRSAPRAGARPAARDVLQTREGGYLLAVRPGQLDAQVFTATLREARGALGRDDRAASALLSRALGLWQGTALCDVPTGPVLRTWLAALEEERVGAHEQRIDADLRLGRHHDLLGELSALTARHPTHENLHAQFMLALHRSGQRTRALEVMGNLRRELRNGLGLDPSPRMHRLHQAILACDPVIDAPPSGPGALTLDLAGPPPPPAVPPVPAAVSSATVKTVKTVTAAKSVRAAGAVKAGQGARAVQAVPGSAAPPRGRAPRPVPRPAPRGGC